jgi:beta-mannanase
MAYWVVMKGRYTTQWIVGLLVLLVAIVAVIQFLGRVPGVVNIGYKPHEIVYGTVDPEGSFNTTAGIAVDHTFVAWRKDDIKEFNSEIEKSLNLKREPLITIEPWSFTQKGNTLFKDIVSGDYKSTIEAMCKVADQKNTEIILRWGHEMDYAGSSRYPWASNDAEGYVSAYRYWVNTCRSVITNNKVLFMWSPGGKNGLEKYYPGSSFVDIVGLSLYGYPEYEQKTLGNTESFTTAFNQKYDRVKGFDKKIYLAETGVAGSDDYKKNWLNEMYQAASKNQASYPLFYGVIYFQFGDKSPWIEGINAPNFRINPSLFPLK